MNRHATIRLNFNDWSPGHLGNGVNGDILKDLVLYQAELARLAPQCPHSMVHREMQSPRDRRLCCKLLQSDTCFDIVSRVFTVCCYWL